MSAANLRTYPHPGASLERSHEGVYAPVRAPTMWSGGGVQRPEALQSLAKLRGPYQATVLQARTPFEKPSERAPSRLVRVHEALQADRYPNIPVVHVLFML